MKKLVQIVILLLVLFPIAAYCGDWELMDNPFSNTDTMFTSIWGSSSDDVYVVGDWGHPALQRKTVDDTEHMRQKIAGVWGSSKHNVYVGGTDIIGQSRGFGCWHFRPQIDLSTYCFVTTVGGIRNDML